MPALLELINVEYYYRHIRVVKGISLTVQTGEMVTLIGANGAGKTTTLQTISGLTPGRGVRGKILFEGKEIQGLPGNRITKLGISQAVEGRQVFAKLTVEENLKMGAFLRRDARAIKSDMADIYRRFPRLLERKTQMAGTLSGGEQQMLAIGRALISRPKLMLMDEPSLGLAPLLVKEIFDAIRQINNDGTTILFVEQNSQIALSTAKRGYVMQVGEIVLADTCENLIINEDVKKAYLGIT